MAQTPEAKGKGARKGNLSKTLARLFERPRKTAAALGRALAKLGKRLAKHPLCNAGLHKWQMDGWGRCARRRCDAYRSFGKVVGIEGDEK